MNERLTTTAAISRITLNNGVEMPVLGFGVYQIPAGDTEQAVTDALATGYRLLDTAASYGNEEAVGRAIASSGIAREDLFVTTKLWIQDGPGEEAAKRAFASSLERLGLDYIDLYLIHQPLGDYYGYWRAMEKLNREGSAKAIGVSNFYPDRLLDLLEHNEITPAVNQIETHPFFQRSDYQELMLQKRVQMESWGPFAEGRTICSQTQHSARSALCKGSRSLRSSYAGSSSEGSSSSPSPSELTGCARTWMSSTSISPTSR
jgi:2,5-diketo-D-gluconate reductase A